MYRRFGGTKGAPYEQGTIISSMVKEMKIISWEQNFFVHQRTASSVKRGEFVSDRMSYIVLRGRWCNIIVLNVHAPSEYFGSQPQIVKTVQLWTCRTRI